MQASAERVPRAGAGRANKAPPAPLRALRDPIPPPARQPPAGLLSSALSMRDKTPQSAGQRLALPVCSSPGLCQHRGSLPDTGPGLWGWAGAGGAFPCRAASSPWPLWPWVPHHLEWGSCSRAGVHSGLVLGSFGVPEKHPRASRWQQDKAEVTKGSHGMWLDGGEGSRACPLCWHCPSSSARGCTGLGAAAKEVSQRGDTAAVQHTQPPSPHRGAGSSLSLQQGSPNTNRPHTCPSQLLPRVPEQGMGCSPPGSPLPHALPQDGCTGSPTGCCHQSPPWQ